MSVITKIEQVIGKDAEAVGAYVKKEFVAGVTKAAPVAVIIANAVKTSLINGVAFKVADLVDLELHTSISPFLVANATTIENICTDVQVDALGLEAVAAGETPAEIDAFAKAASAAYLSGTAYAKSEVATNLAEALIVGLTPLIPDLEAGTATYAEVVGDAETAFQNFEAAQADDAADTTD